MNAKESVNPSPASMHAAGKTGHRQLLCVHFQLRTGSLTLGLQAQIARETARDIQSQQTLQILELRDGQRHLTMQLLLVGASSSDRLRHERFSRSHDE